MYLVEIHERHALLLAFCVKGFFCVSAPSPLEVLFPESVSGAFPPLKTPAPRASARAPNPPYMYGGLPILS